MLSLTCYVNGKCRTQNVVGIIHDFVLHLLQAGILFLFLAFWLALYSHRQFSIFFMQPGFLNLTVTSDCDFTSFCVAT
jgi:hypothetical protein